MTAQKKLEVLQNTLWDVIQSQDGRNPAYERNQVESLKAAIFALEKQMPKKPIGKIDPMFGDSCIVCPNCENTAIVNPFTRSKFKHCPNCGQALDWE